MTSPSTQRIAVGLSAIPYTDQKPRTDSAPERFINRDLSQVEFFRRVLEEALDPNQALLERLKFISIFSSLMDEFFMIRVSALKEKIDESFASPDALPRQQLL